MYRCRVSACHCCCCVLMLWLMHTHTHTLCLQCRPPSRLRQMPDVNEMANEPQVLMPLPLPLISENMFQISIVNFINRQRVYSSDDNITAPACADEGGWHESKCTTNSTEAQSGLANLWDRKCVESKGNLNKLRKKDFSSAAQCLSLLSGKIVSIFIFHELSTHVNFMWSPTDCWPCQWNAKWMEIFLKRIYHSLSVFSSHFFYFSAALPF